MGRRRQPEAVVQGGKLGRRPAAAHGRGSDRVLRADGPVDRRGQQRRVDQFQRQRGQPLPRAGAALRLPPDQRRLHLRQRQLHGDGIVPPGHRSAGRAQPDRPGHEHAGDRRAAAVDGPAVDEHLDQRLHVLHPDHQHRQCDQERFRSVPSGGLRPQGRYQHVPWRHDGGGRPAERAGAGLARQHLRPHGGDLERCAGTAAHRGDDLHQRTADAQRHGHDQRRRVVQRGLQQPLDRSDHGGRRRAHRFQHQQHAESGRRRQRRGRPAGPVPRRRRADFRHQQRAGLEPAPPDQGQRQHRDAVGRQLLDRLHLPQQRHAAGHADGSHLRQHVVPGLDRRRLQPQQLPPDHRRAAGRQRRSGQPGRAGLAGHGQPDGRRQRQQHGLARRRQRHGRLQQAGPGHHDHGRHEHLLRDHHRQQRRVDRERRLAVLRAYDLSRRHADGRRPDRPSDRRRHGGSGQRPRPGRRAPVRPDPARGRRHPEGGHERRQRRRRHRLGPAQFLRRRHRPGQRHLHHPAAGQSGRIRQRPQLFLEDHERHFGRRRIQREQVRRGSGGLLPEPGRRQIRRGGGRQRPLPDLHDRRRHPDLGRRRRRREVGHRGQLGGRSRALHRQDRRLLRRAGLRPDHPAQQHAHGRRHALHGSGGHFADLRRHHAVHGRQRPRHPFGFGGRARSDLPRHPAGFADLVERFGSRLHGGGPDLGRARAAQGRVGQAGPVRQQRIQRRAVRGSGRRADQLQLQRHGRRRGAGRHQRHPGTERQLPLAARGPDPVRRRHERRRRPAPDFVRRGRVARRDHRGRRRADFHRVRGLQHLQRDRGGRAHPLRHELQLVHDGFQPVHRHADGRRRRAAQERPRRPVPARFDAGRQRRRGPGRPAPGGEPGGRRRRPAPARPGGADRQQRDGSHDRQAHVHRRQRGAGRAGHLPRPAVPVRRRGPGRRRPQPVRQQSRHGEQRHRQRRLHQGRPRHDDGFGREHLFGQYRGRRRRPGRQRHVGGLDPYRQLGRHPARRGHGGTALHLGHRGSRQRRARRRDADRRRPRDAQRHGHAEDRHAQRRRRGRHRLGSPGRQRHGERAGVRPVRRLGHGRRRRLRARRQPELADRRRAARGRFRLRSRPVHRGRLRLRPGTLRGHVRRLERRGRRRPVSDLRALGAAAGLLRRGAHRPDRDGTAVRTERRRPERGHRLQRNGRLRNAVRRPAGGGRGLRGRHGRLRRRRIPADPRGPDQLHALLLRDVFVLRRPLLDGLDGRRRHLAAVSAGGARGDADRHRQLRGELGRLHGRHRLPAGRQHEPVFHRRRLGRRANGLPGPGLRRRRRRQLGHHPGQRLRLQRESDHGQSDGRAHPDRQLFLAAPQRRRHAAARARLHRRLHLPHGRGARGQHFDQQHQRGGNRRQGRHLRGAQRRGVLRRAGRRNHRRQRRQRPVAVQRHRRRGHRRRRVRQRRFAPGRFQPQQRRHRADFHPGRRLVPGPQDRDDQQRHVGIVGHRRHQGPGRVHRVELRGRLRRPVRGGPRHQPARGRPGPGLHLLLPRARGKLRRLHQRQLRHGTGGHDHRRAGRSGRHAVGLRRHQHQPRLRRVGRPGHGDAFPRVSRRIDRHQRRGRGLDERHEPDELQRRDRHAGPALLLLGGRLEPERPRRLERPRSGLPQARHRDERGRHRRRRHQPALEQGRRDLERRRRRNRLRDLAQPVLRHQHRRLRRHRVGRRADVRRLHGGAGLAVLLLDRGHQLHQREHGRLGLAGRRLPDADRQRGRGDRRVARRPRNDPGDRRAELGWPSHPGAAFDRSPRPAVPRSEHQLQHQQQRRHRASGLQRPRRRIPRARGGAEHDQPLPHLQHPGRRRGGPVPVLLRRPDPGQPADHHAVSRERLFRDLLLHERGFEHGQLLQQDRRPPVDRSLGSADGRLRPRLDGANQRRDRPADVPRHPVELSDRGRQSRRPAGRRHRLQPRPPRHHADQQRHDLRGRHRGLPVRRGPRGQQVHDHRPDERRQHRTGIRQGLRPAEPLRHPPQRRQRQRQQLRNARVGRAGPEHQRLVLDGREIRLQRRRRHGLRQVLLPGTGDSVLRADGRRMGCGLDRHGHFGNRRHRTQGRQRRWVFGRRGLG